MILFIAFLFASFAAKAATAAACSDKAWLHPSGAAAELVVAVVLPISSAALDLDVISAFRFSDSTWVRIRLLALHCIAFVAVCQSTIPLRSTHFFLGPRANYFVGAVANTTLLPQVARSRRYPQRPNPS